MLLATISSRTAWTRPLQRNLSTSARCVSVRVRFAPSPTGSLHLGGLRTALANFLLAKSKGGTWIVRVEDTDQNRLTPGAVENLSKTLAWAGLHPDAAPWSPPEQDKLQVGPYRQSQRLALYRAAALDLVAQGKAYYDFRSPSDAASASPGRYTPPTADEAKRLVDAGTLHTIRLFRPSTIEDLTYEDLIYGHLKFNSEAEFSREGDVVLLKRDGFPTYHLASVVDDHAMGITHVLRGEEWIASLPTHLRLYDALGYTPPQFAHMPLLMTSDGRKLSKRHGDASVETYIERGYEPSAVINFVALLGYNHKTKVDHSAPSYVPLGSTAKEQITGPGEEVFTLPQLAQHFDVGRLSPSRSSPDPAKLDFLNRAHIRFALSVGLDGPDGWGGEYQLVLRRSRTFLEQACGDALLPSDKTDHGIHQLTSAFIERAHTLFEAAQTAATLLRGPDWNSPDAQEFRASIDTESYRAALTHAHAVFITAPETPDEHSMATLVDQSIVSLSKNKSSKERKKSKAITMRSLRHAVAGEKVGPALPLLLSLLGPTRVATRIEEALKRDEQHTQT